MAENDLTSGPAMQECGICSNGLHKVYHLGGPCPYVYPRQEPQVVGLISPRLGECQDCADLRVRLKAAEFQLGGDTGHDCIFCGLRIYGTMVGAGDGTGGKFAHKECWLGRDQASLRNQLAEARDETLEERSEVVRLDAALKDLQARYNALREAAELVLKGGGYLPRPLAGGSVPEGPWNNIIPQASINRLAAALATEAEEEKNA